MNEQEIFNTVVRHLGKQGVQSLNEFECAYRTSDGLSCAAGCLIPDELYHSDIEGFIVGDMLFSKHPYLVEALPWFKENWKLIRRLQNAHDVSWAGGDDSLVDALYIISSEFNLDSSVIAEAFPGVQPSQGEQQ
jgi:hypothetical protein